MRRHILLEKRMFAPTDIQRVGRQALSEGYLIRLPQGLECKVMRLCATKLPSLIEREIQRRDRKDGYVGGSKLQIDVMRNHYFPRYMTAIFRKKRVCFGLILDFGKGFDPDAFLTLLDVCTLIQSIEKGEPLNLQDEAYTVTYGFIGLRLYSAEDHCLKTILKAASQYTTPQAAVLLAEPACEQAA